MLQVDRGKYAREPEYAYNDHPSGIGDGQTIRYPSIMNTQVIVQTLIGVFRCCSAPHMHAMCMELLEEKLKPGARALGMLLGGFYQVVGSSMCL